jgi:hypothetical protein
LFEEEMVLTPERLQAGIQATVDAAVSDIVPPEPVDGVSIVQGQNVSTTRWSARFGASTASASGEVADTQTWHHTQTTEVPPSWVRLIWPYDQLDTCTIQGAIIAPSASVTSPINPVDASGNPVSWIPVTFNNAGLPLTLAAQLDAEDDQAGADDTTQVLFEPPINGSVWPDGPRLKSQKYTYSDWIPIKSLARTDVPGGYPIIMHRVKFEGPISLTQAVSDADHLLMDGHQVRAYANAGDCVATPANFVSTTLTDIATPILQYITTHPVVSLAVAGDSTQTPTANHVSLTALAISTDENPVEFFAGGTGGFDAEAYCGNMRRLAPHLKLSIVFIEVRSANGILGVADAESDWATATALADTVRGYGGIPVLMTPIPCPARINTAGDPTAVEASRLDIVARCLAAQEAGMHVLDLNEFFSDGATPVANFRTGTSNDGIHPTDTGQSDCATTLTTPFTRTLLGL